MTRGVDDDTSLLTWYARALHAPSPTYLIPSVARGARACDWDDAPTAFTARGGACRDWASRAFFQGRVRARPASVGCLLYISGLLSSSPCSWYAQNLISSNLISGQFQTTRCFCSETPPTRL
ncbi:unnamed protein product [Camellia sinensis]